MTAAAVKPKAEMINSVDAEGSKVMDELRNDAFLGNRIK